MVTGAVVIGMNVATIFVSAARLHGLLVSLSWRPASGVEARHRFLLWLQQDPNLKKMTSVASSFIGE